MSMKQLDLKMKLLREGETFLICKEITFMLQYEIIVCSYRLERVGSRKYCHRFLRAIVSLIQKINPSDTEDLAESLIVSCLIFSLTLPTPTPASLLS